MIKDREVFAVTHTGREDKACNYRLYAVYDSLEAAMTAITEVHEFKHIIKKFTLNHTNYDIVYRDD